jgi:hypothetical protein
MATIYALLTEDGLDQFVETKEQMEKEKSWLKLHGYTVKVKAFDNWKDAEAFEDKLNSK